MGKIERNKAFLSGFFTGPFTRHALVYEPPAEPRGELGDFTLSDKPVSEWVPYYVREYKKRVRAVEELDDDGVPFVTLNTNTGIFAAAFGCPLRVYQTNTNAAARPIVKTTAEADGLPEPGLDAPALARVLELGQLLQQELGNEVIIGVPDIQSPFGIASLIWDKADHLTAMIEAPEAVNELTAKCHRLLKKFLREFKSRFPGGNLCHCPYAWAPPALGCWLSEDEIGIISAEMFEEFCLPWLTDLSQTFGGIFIHCCADAAHQYEGFKKIPDLRGLNLSHKFGVDPFIEAFSGRCPLMFGYTPEAAMMEMLGKAKSDTRYLFNVNAPTPEAAKPLMERLRLKTGHPRV